MKITHISAECYPVAKVGGLADVVGALPKYQNDAGITTEVIMPFSGFLVVSGQMLFWIIVDHLGLVPLYRIILS